MQLEYDFTVPVPVARAWSVLLDLERVAPCVPGATLTSFDGDAFTGTVLVKLGPISLTYQGRGRFVSRDEQAGVAVIEASGRDKRGAGTASTTATMRLRPADDGAATVVAMVADLSVTGRPAQFGRGMIAEVGGKLVGQFAECLAQRLAEAPAATPAGATASGASASGAPASGAAPAAASPDAGSAVETAPTSATAETDVATATASSPTASSPTASSPTVPLSPAAPLSPSTVESAPPVDLLRVGTGPVLRRVAPYAIGFVAGALVTWALFAWLG